MSFPPGEGRELLIEYIRVLKKEKYIEAKYTPVSDPGAIQTAVGMLMAQREQAFEVNEQIERDPEAKIQKSDPKKQAASHSYAINVSSYMESIEKIISMK